MTIRQAQAQCRRWREDGDTISIRKADRLEAEFRDLVDYESDHMWLLRMQSGEQARR
jgi:hypothetical protein